MLRRDGFKKPSSRYLPKIAIIFDDLGYDYDIARALIHIDLPISLSLLPLAPYRGKIVTEARKRGSELMLHLPMEPKSYPDLSPGPGAVYTHMRAEEIERTLGDHLDRIPGVRGVNNHMGSLFTERRDKMELVLRELKRRNLFYVDSRTTAGTVAYELAKKMGIPVGKRSAFLDNDLNSRAIEFQFERLLGLARHSGKAIGIGHPHTETLKVLMKYHDRLQKDFKVVPASQLVN